MNENRFSKWSSNLAFFSAVALAVLPLAFVYAATAGGISGIIFLALLIVAPITTICAFVFGIIGRKFEEKALVNKEKFSSEGIAVICFLLAALAFLILIEIFG